ncbi:hypothetical protein [Bradyrhizobium sp. WD16]|nr:hypothetical protein [Bradyrhizobium sp. WD16]
MVYAILRSTYDETVLQATLALGLLSACAVNACLLLRCLQL